MRNQAPVLAPLFRSEAQALLLSELLLPAEEMSLTDLAERAGLPYPTVHREVARLLEAGLLAERRVGRTRLIRGNEQSPLLAPTRDILLTVTGPVVLLREALEDLDGIEHAYLFGSFAARAKGEPGPPPNDIDLMVVGTPDTQAVYRVCREVSDAVGRIVDPTILSPEEAAEQTGFLEEVRAGAVIEIYGGGPDGPGADAGTAEGS